MSKTTKHKQNRINYINKNFKDASHYKITKLMLTYIYIYIYICMYMYMYQFSLKG